MKDTSDSKLWSENICDACYFKYEISDGLCRACTCCKLCCLCDKLYDILMNMPPEQPEQLEDIFPGCDSEEEKQNLDIAQDNHSSKLRKMALFLMASSLGVIVLAFAIISFISL